MTEKEISRVLREKYKRTPPSRRAVRASKLKMRYGKDWERLRLEIQRTREKLDILMGLQRDWEQRKIAEYRRHGDEQD